MRQRLWALLGLLLFPTLLYASGSEQTINPLPAANAQFQTNLSTFLKREDAQRYELLFESMVLSGGTHSTVGSLTAAPASLIAFPGGHYVTEVGSITYANNETTWVIAHKDLTGNLSNFVRVAGTHYLIDSTSASKPTLPADSVWLMEVTTSGGAVTAVVDLRTRVPYMGTYLQAELPAFGQRGRLAFVRDGSTLALDTGSAWISLATNPMTAATDLIVGGTGGVPTRLPKGTANQVLGMNNANTAQEYKTIAAGSGISVGHAANTVTIGNTSTAPTGSLQMYIGTAAPTGWLLCDGAIYDADTHPDLFDVAVVNASAWGLGTVTGIFTVNTGTDTITLTAHGLANGSRVHVANSGGGLPAGLSANTKYFVISSTTDTFQLSTTAGGSAIDITTAGTGTHSAYNSFQVPDFRARMPVGTGAATKDFTISAVNTGTEELTVDSNTALYTGDAILYDTTAGAIGGLTDATIYYVIRVSATVVKLATTELLAVTGTAINLTSSGSGVQVLRQTLTTRAVGVTGGSEQLPGTTGTHILTIAQMPAHTHMQNHFTAGGPGAAADTAGFDANISDDMLTDSTGGGGGHEHTVSPHSLMNPFLAITFIVKT